LNILVFLLSSTGHSDYGARRELFNPKKGENVMKLNAPKKITWLISLIIGALGIVAHLVAIPVLSVYAFWLVVVGFVLLVLGTFLKGL
jgi:hypothetical protein